MKKQLEGKPIQGQNGTAIGRSSQMSLKNLERDEGEKELLRMKIEELQGQVMKSHERGDDRKYKELKVIVC